MNDFLLLSGNHNDELPSACYPASSSQNFVAAGDVSMGRNLSQVSPAVTSSWTGLSSNQSSLSHSLSTPNN